MALLYHCHLPFFLRFFLRSGQKSKVAILEETEVIEPRRNVGLLGHQGFFIPRFAGVRDPKLLTFFGLRGEENRRKMAETFLRPTSWKQYCELVSTDNCTTPTNVTSRPPAVDSENDRMFVEGEYAGYFRKTDDHDCDKNPDTCHGGEFS